MAYKNKEMAKKCRDRWYQKNSEKQKARQKERRKELRNWLIELKQKSFCADCNMSFKDKPECVDFHHINPLNKDIDVAKLTRYSQKRILNEISKCIILCANCHRTRHKIN